MNVSALYNYYHEKSDEHYNQIYGFVAASLLHIIGHYFSNFSNYFVLTICSHRKQTVNFYDEMFDSMLAEWKEWPLQIVNLNKESYEKVLGDRQFNIIFTDSYEAFLKTEIHTYTANYNINEYYFIFLQTRDHLIPNEMKKIFEYCWQNYLINCVIQIEKANGQIQIFTYFPFTANYCGQVEAILVNEWNGTSLTHEELFPGKLKNFYGCPLRVAICHIPPYVHLATNENNVPYISGGFEGKLLLELSKKLNFSLDIILPPEDRALAMKNKSITPAFKMVYEHRADITLGSARQTRKRMMFFTSSLHYYQTRWIVVTLSEAYKLTSLETLMFPFSRDAWYLLAFIGICTLSAFALLNIILPKYLLKHLHHVVLDVLLIGVGMPALVKPAFSSTRILKVTWILFSLVIRTIYQALLFHLIRTHVIRNMPETLKDLVEKNYTLIVDRHTYEGLKKISTFETINFIVMNTTDHSMPLKYLEEMHLHNNARYMAAALPSLRFLYYIEKNNKMNDFKILPQNLLNVKLSMFFYKHSFLVEQFDEVLMMFKGFGILQAWLNQEFDNIFSTSIHPQVNKTFGMKQLKMAFVLLLVGYLIALVVCILELLHKMFKRYKTVRQFLKSKFCSKRMKL